MAFEQHLGDELTLRLGDHPVTIRQLVLVDVFRLLRLIDRVKSDLGISQAEVEKMEISPAGLTRMLERLLEVCVGSIDLDSDETRIEGTALVVCRELGRMVKAPPEAVLFAPLDDLARVIEAFWEANAAGPLGQRARRTIGEWTPRLRVLTDLLMMNLQLELTRGRLAGGMTAGGTTTSSSPSTDASVGPSTTSPESYQPDASSPSSPPLATSPDTRRPSHEAEASLAAPTAAPASQA